ncbi:mannitol-1-phosphate 5-dehydrogenase [Halobacillus fulvus]|nr:mannitol-1-phosphate 5-dehydrogenase [Halobacillus fulvus]
MKALHFGAGNIGKGLIGYLLNKTGYDVCFVDVNAAAVQELNDKQGYPLQILDEQRTTEWISPVRAISGLAEKEVIEAITDADLITTSVGVNNLDKISPVLAKGLLKRAQTGKDPVDLIANENMINASSKLEKEIKKHLTESEKNAILSKVEFPNSAIDRLSLSETKDGNEVTTVEPYYEWLIETKEMTDKGLPSIKGATYVDTLQPFIERKLYIVNLGHAATAYIASLKGEETIQDALKKTETGAFLRQTLQESARYFTHAYDFGSVEMSDFIERTIKRFKNPNVSDAIKRVGRSPIRKLGPDERLIKPLTSLFEWGLPTEKLTTATAAAFLFNHEEDEEAVTLQAYIREHGIEQAITHFTGIEQDALIKQIKEEYVRLKTLYTTTLSNER